MPSDPSSGSRLPTYITLATALLVMDPMPTSLVVGCLDVLLAGITRIVNLSLSSGYFLAEWKEALVCPLLKKAGLYPAFKNLRPVSNLQFLSKLTERAVFDQMYNLIHIKNPSMYGLRSNSELLLAPRKLRKHSVTGLLLLLHHHFGTNCRVKFGMRTILNV